MQRRTASGVQGFGVLTLDTEATLSVVRSEKPCSLRVAIDACPDAGLSLWLSARC